MPTLNAVTILPGKSLLQTEEMATERKRRRADKNLRVYLRVIKRLHRRAGKIYNIIADTINREKI